MSGIVGQNAGRDSGVVGAVDSTVSDNAIDETKLKDALVADFTEVTVAAGDSILLGDSSDSGNTKRDTVQGLLDLVPAGGQYKLLKGTWDISTTGSLAITGVGFAPKHILFMAAVSGQPTASFGMGDDDGTEWILYNQHENSANDWAVVVDSTIASIPLSGGGQYAYLTVSSYDADGITLSRTKYSTPTGTGQYAITFFG
jgi:hypothetical protein|tara:strand:- start:602 stop:1201 length:600 start_codon:yes stop_codon:yes gene_type:complete